VKRSNKQILTDTFKDTPPCELKGASANEGVEPYKRLSEPPKKYSEGFFPNRDKGNLE